MDLSAIVLSRDHELSPHAFVFHEVEDSAICVAGAHVAEPRETQPFAALARG